RYFSEEAKMSHISDPRTGKSSEKLISATVIVPYTTTMIMPAMTADALATAVFVMGVEGVDMIEMIDGAEALVITNEREIIRTSGFGGYEEVGE
ncbi:MAG: FAD:protein FMN transferase, partial [Methanosarcinales archaeon]|nr:FAD:protein FMN transferase [Methanosarcinales archaeon]